MLKKIYQNTGNPPVMLLIKEHVLLAVFEFIPALLKVVNTNSIGEMTFTSDGIASKTVKYFILSMTS